MRTALLIAPIALLIASCGPAAWVNRIPGFHAYPGDLLPQTTESGDLEVTVANVVAGKPGYLEFHIAGRTSVSHLLLSVDDHVFVASVDDLTIIGVCDWLGKGNQGGPGGLMGGILGDLGASISACTPACEEACSCIQACADLPNDLGLVGSAAALCTSSCSQTGGAITASEFAGTFTDIYRCFPSTCGTRPSFEEEEEEEPQSQWVGMIEIDYPEIKSEAIVVQPVAAPHRESMKGETFATGTIAGPRKGCVPIR